jgi:pyruvate/2-oxoglutarate dehydrogenase complex dihydrolipoamide dehydrogenase (E3) component
MKVLSIMFHFRGVEYINGFGSFVDAQTIKVTDQNGKEVIYLPLYCHTKNKDV